MSCGRIIGIVCMAISGISYSACWAQEAGPQKSEGTSISERLAALKNSLSRDESSSSSPRTTNRRSAASRTTKTKKKSSGGSILPRIQVNDLLPGNLFGRKEAKTSKAKTREAQQPSQPPQPTRNNVPPPQPTRNNVPPTRNNVPPAVSSQRAGGNTNNMPAMRTARRSPVSSRNNELESALSELIDSPDVQVSDQSTIEPPDAAETQSTPAFLQDDFQDTPQQQPKRSEPSQPKEFDLHEALQDDEPESEDDITSETADEASEVIVDNTPMPAEATDQSVVTDAIPDLAAEPVLASEDVVDASETITPSYVEEKNSDPFDADAERAFSAPQAQTNQAPTAPVTELMDILTEDEKARPFTEPSPSYQQDVLSSYQQPVIVSHVEGPRRILVGREANYQVTLENKSNLAAQSVSTSVRIPPWADIVDATSSSGTVERSSVNTEAGTIRWQLRELGARSSQTLKLRLIPRSGRALQLGVQWSQSPVGSQTVVEVQEPKLEISLGGPNEVLFGKPQRYRLSLHNPGTGLAEKIVIRLIPPGGDAGSATTHNFGSLNPGQSQEIDLELTAREAGELVIQASATAAGGLKSKTVKKVLCSKPELQVDWRGPNSKYVGNMASYYFRISNPGTATTDPVQVSVELPKSASLASASNGHSFNAENGVATWRLAGLAPHEEQFLQIRCRVDRPGKNQFAVTAETSSGDLRNTQTIETNVIALADLKLDVSDPKGAVPVGESAEYVIRVSNRGSIAAQGVNIVGLFSEDINPISVEGAQYTIHDGRVTFQAIKNLPAGGELLLKIHAEATRPGTHIFRAEVLCQDLDTKLAAEETTRFFKDEYRWDDKETPYTAERNDNEAVTR